jgi:hypothetical protein
MSDRSDFYFKQLVTEAEMDQAFDDLETADRNMIADQTDGVHAVWGVFEGYEVTENSGTPDLNVEVANGVAYDEQGRRIPHTAGPTLVDLASGVPGSDSRYVRVYAVYAEVTSDPRVDGSGTPLDYRITESVTFEIQLGAIAASPVRPAILTDRVLIATVLIATGATQIFDADISQALQEDPWNPTVIDRQEGGVVFPHGRMAVRTAYFLPPPGAVPVRLDMGANHLRTSQGDIQMDDIDLPSESGGRIFMQRGSIYRCGEVRTEGPPSASAGYLYCEAGTGKDEFGTALLPVRKNLNYDALAFLPAGGNAQDKVVDPAPVANSWNIVTSGIPAPATAVTEWDFNINGGPFFEAPLGLALVGLPDGCRLVDLYVYANVPLAMNANAQVALAWYRRDASGVQLINNGGTISWVNFGATGPQNINTIVDPSYHTVFTGTYAYYCYVLVRSTGAIAGPVNLNFDVRHARLRYDIREASHVY